MVNYTIAQLEELAENITSFRPEEYSDKLFLLRLREETLTEEQFKRYQMAIIRNHTSLMKYLKKIFAGQNADAVLSWLDVWYFQKISIIFRRNPGICSWNIWIF